MEQQSSSLSHVLLMASFCCVEAQLLGADRGEHLSLAAVALPVTEGPGTSLAATAVRGPRRGRAVLGPCASIRACLHLSMGK